MNVLHFPANYASRVFHNVNALNEYGISSRSVICTSNKYQMAEGLNVLGARFPQLYQKGKIRTLLLRGLLFKEVVQSLDWADVLHWYTGSSLLHLPLDIEFVSRKAKTQAKFVHWQGDDLRDPLYEMEVNPWYAQAAKQWPLSLLKKQARRNKEKQKRFLDAGFIPLVPLDLVDHLLPEWKGTAIPIRHTVDTHVLVPTPKKVGDRIRIAHAPTDNIVKGTNIILRTLEKLQKKLPIEIVLLTNMTRSDVVRNINDADIFIDNMLQGMYCLASLEAMSLGIPTICNVLPRIQKQLPVEFPLHTATPDSLEEVIVSLVEDRDMWKTYAQQSRSYVEKNHSYVVMGKYLSTVYRDTISSRYE